MGLKQAVSIVRTGLRLRLEAVRISNCPAKLDATKLEHLRLDLQNRFVGLQLDKDASPEN